MPLIRLLIVDVAAGFLATRILRLHLDAPTAIAPVWAWKFRIS